MAGQAQKDSVSLVQECLCCPSQDEPHTPPREDRHATQDAIVEQGLAYSPECGIFFLEKGHRSPRNANSRRGPGAATDGVQVVRNQPKGGERCCKARQGEDGIMVHALRWLKLGNLARINGCRSRDARETSSRANVSLHDVKPSSSLRLCYVLAGCLSWSTGDEAQEHRAQQLGGQSFSYTARHLQRDERRRAATTSVESRASQIDENKEGSQKKERKKKIGRGIELNGRRVQGLTEPIAPGSLRMAARWIGNRKSTGQARNFPGHVARSCMEKMHREGISMRAFCRGLLLSAEDRRIYSMRCIAARESSKGRDRDDTMGGGNGVGSL
ncbi:hypothetical protein PspLS_08137 [Pyricularia sp. CBS 133598]|nr:hypothetical protein PspLS_08137 [Pyricularia sp. CBS 133598]